MAKQETSSAIGGTGSGKAKYGMQSTPGGGRSGRALAGGAGYSVKMTTPVTLVRHDISDEDLTVLLSHDDRPFEKDILWTSAGAMVGALAPTIQALKSFARDDGTFGVVDLTSCLIFAIGLMLVIVMGVILWRKPPRSAAQTLAAEIRARATAKEFGIDSRAAR